MATGQAPPAGEPPKVHVALPIPSTRVLKLAALACFVLDLLSGALGFGERLHLVALGLAMWVADEVIERQ
jgi:hypothetical protein